MLYTRVPRPYRSAMIRSSTKRLALLTLTAGLAFSASTAFAQVGIASEPTPGAAEEQADLRTPPKIEPTDSYRSYITMGAVFLCAAAVAGVVIIPSQRTHQD